MAVRSLSIATCRSKRRRYQHGNVTTFEHSVRVACLAVWMADRAHLWYRVDLKSLIRAALLHDYFLYDWHDWDNGEHQWHGFTHGHAALVNALKDFKLNDIELNSIENHMLPDDPGAAALYRRLIWSPWRTNASATAETFSFDRFNKRALPAAKPYAEIEARR